MIESLHISFHHLSVIFTHETALPFKLQQEKFGALYLTTNDNTYFWTHDQWMFSNNRFLDYYFEMKKKYIYWQRKLHYEVFNTK